MRILLADKDPAILELVSTRLTARHYEVLGLSQSEEALRTLDRDRVDLILLSTAMERIGRKLLIEKIREREHLAAVPIILMAHEEELSELVLSRDRGFDDFLIKPFSPLVLQVRVALNISRAQWRVEANALTHLPGNIAIEKVIRTKIKIGEKFSVLYGDINHFKSFNDRYGFEKGDDVIRQTAKLLIQTKEKTIREGECFIGHIGGDDFIVVLHPDYEETFARSFIGEFDRIMPTYYNEADQKQGFIRITNRRGKAETFPLMSCSVAACNNLHRPYKSLGEIAQDAAEVKAFLKLQPGSHYLRDRRSEPIRRVEEAVELLSSEIPASRIGGRIDPLGQVLLNAGLIDQEELSSALKRHLETGQRLGQTLISMNLVRSEDVGRMLEKKLNVPYVSLKQFPASLEMLRLFTLDFMKSHRVVPLEVTGSSLKLAMCDPFDLKTLDAIERVSGLKPVPCLALEDEFEEFVEAYMAEAARNRHETKIG
jgi:diguanylate cyclase (GGDEF)-like protein